MENAGKIKVYHTKQNGRQKKPYGPTVYGFIFFYGTDKRVSSKVENYFLLWLDHKEFQDDLRREGFDVEKTVSSPQKSKILFRKYAHYFSGVEKQLDMIKKGTYTIPSEVSLFIGEALLTMNPEYRKIWEELYSNLPGIRNNVDTYIENTIKMYQQIKKKYN